jgi:hypothetical protein
MVGLASTANTSYTALGPNIDTRAGVSVRKSAVVWGCYVRSDGGAAAALRPTGCAAPGGNPRARPAPTEPDGREAYLRAHAQESQLHTWYVTTHYPNLSPIIVL